MMPFVNIRIVRQAIAADPVGKKAAISQKVAAVIAEETGLPQSDVWTVFEEVEAENWFLGQNSVQKLRFDK
jgi:4-oxalocrotonate tautomerase